MTDKNTMWNSAARSGLVLGCVSIVFMILGHFLSKTGTGTGAAVASSIADSILWIAKFCLCIFLMRRYIFNYIADTGAGQYEARSFGRKTALLSALLYSGAYLAYILYINPTIFTDTADAIAESGMLTSEQMEILDSSMGRMPAAAFFANLVYCYLFGSVLSLIFTAGIGSNPFDEEDDDAEQAEDDTLEN